MLKNAKNLLNISARAYDEIPKIAPMRANLEN